MTSELWELMNEKFSDVRGDIIANPGQNLNEQFGGKRRKSRCK